MNYGIWDQTPKSVSYFFISVFHQQDSHDQPCVFSISFQQSQLLSKLNLAAASIGLKLCYDGHVTNHLSSTGLFFTKRFAVLFFVYYKMLTVIQIDFQLQNVTCFFWKKQFCADNEDLLSQDQCQHSIYKSWKRLLVIQLIWKNSELMRNLYFFETRGQKQTIEYYACIDISFLHSSRTPNVS